MRKLTPSQGRPGLVAAVLAAALTVALSACGGGSKAKSTGSLPVITSFSAATSTLTAGKSTQLTWVVGGATTVSIDNGVGTVTGAMVAVTPAATTTYTLTATGPGGSVTAQATVTVVAAPVSPTVQFSASPTSIAAGSGSTLSWSVSGATKISIDQGIGDVQATGSKAITPGATTTYTLTATATNAAGDAVTAPPASATVSVVSVTGFQVSTSSINAGGTGATLSWTASPGASSLVLQVKVTDANGQATTSTTDVTGKSALPVNPTAAAYPATAQYTLVAKWGAFTVTAGPVQLTVTSTLGAIQSFLASTLVNGASVGTASTAPGGTVQLYATLNGADSLGASPSYAATVTGSDGWSQAGTLNGSPPTATVTPTVQGSTSYTLDVTDTQGAGGTQAQALQVIAGSFAAYSGEAIKAQQSCAQSGAVAGYKFATGSPTQSVYCSPWRMATDPTGNLYFTDNQANVIVKVDAATQLSSVFAGVPAYVGVAGFPVQNGTVTSATFRSPGAIAVDAQGNVYVAGTECAVRKISNGQVTTLAGAPAGTVNGTDGNYQDCQLPSEPYGDANGQGSSAQFGYPIIDLAVDSAGDVIVADAVAVRAIDPSGNVTTIAGYLCTEMFVFSCPRDAPAADGTGGPSGTSRFAGIAAMAIGPDDVIYVMDNMMLRTITPTKGSGKNASAWSWNVTTLNGLNAPQGHVDGPVSAARFTSLARAVTVAGDGTVYVADGSWLRRVTGGVVDTIAGNGNMPAMTSSGYRTVPGPLPGQFSPGKGLTVDPTSRRLFFDVLVDTDQIYAMPY